MVAKADGIIQKEEVDALNKILFPHPWASEIDWSFHYENNKGAAIEDVYRKVISYCHSSGPSAVYREIMDAMDLMARAVNGIDGEEKKVIDSFSNDLLRRFKHDLERANTRIDH